MKNQKILTAFLSFIILTFSSCGNNYSDKSESENLSFILSEEKDSPAGQDLENNNRNIKLTSTNETLPFKTDRMIIRKGTIKLEIENYSESEKELFRIVNDLNGYISNSGSIVSASGKRQGNIDIRIQAKDFDTLISEISKTGKVMSLNVNSSDITEEFIDLEARSKTHKALEERLINLLNEKTAKLTDIVEVEQKLADVRTQIESMEGRMRFLKNQSEYSTLSVSLFEPSMLQTASGGGFFYELSKAFKKGLTGFTDVISGLITFIVALSPVLILMIVLFVILKKYYLKRKSKIGGINVQTN